MGFARDDFFQHCRERYGNFVSILYGMNVGLHVSLPKIYIYVIDLCLRSMYYIDKADFLSIHVGIPTVYEQFACVPWLFPAW